MKVSIIGSNSFIARNFIKYLKINKNSYELYLYDFQEEHIDKYKNYERIIFSNKNSISKINFDVDAILIFTGKTGTKDGFENYSQYLLINEEYLLNILSEYVNCGSHAKIIFPSSRLVYKGQETPILENSNKEFKTIYSVSKFSCEKYLEMYNKCFGVNYCILRICVPYGNLLDDNYSYGTLGFMINKAKNKQNIIIYGNGEFRRTFTNIIYICKILEKAINNSSIINDVYNVGGENYSILQVAQFVASKYNVSIDFNEYPELDAKIESGSTVFDSSKLDTMIKDIKYDFDIKKNL